MKEIEELKCRKCEEKFENSSLVFNKHLHMCFECIDIWTEKMDRDRNFIKLVFSELGKLHSERKELELILE